MEKKPGSMAIVRTSRTLLAGLENNMFNRQEQRRAIDSLTSRLAKDNLSRSDEARFLAVMIRMSNQKQKNKVSKIVRARYGNHLKDQMP